MRVLLINSVYGSGSTGRICAQLAAALTDAGHTCCAAYGRGKAAPVAGETLLRIGTDADVRAHGAATRLRDAHGLASSGATRKFLEAANCFDADVIHLHNIHGYYLNYEILFDYLRACGKPVLWTLHDCWAFTGHCAYFDAVHCDRWKSGCGECPQRGAYPASVLADGSRRNFRRKSVAFQNVERLSIVTPSEWLANLTRASFLGDYQVHIIPNGVDSSIFYPQPDDVVAASLPEGVVPGRYLLGVANEWEPRKGLRDFIALADRLSGTGMRLVLVGLSEAQLRDLPPSVFGLRRTESPKALAALYSGCAAYLNLTYEENYPTTNLEAAACGADVITYASGGCAETLHARSAAVPAGDLDAVERLVRALPLPVRENTPCPPLDGRESAARYLALYQKALV